MNKEIKKKFIYFRKSYIQPLFRKFSGWEEMQEQIDSAYYLLNTAFPIGDFPKATGYLRQTQLVDTEMLRIFSDICKKYELEYWLDWGTLLGAVRHKGFIPWDDDLDVSMARDTFNKAKEILPAEMEKYGFTLGLLNAGRMAFNNWNAGANLDIFPMDNVDVAFVQDKDKFEKNFIKYRKYYQKHRNYTYAQLAEKKEKIIGKPNTENVVLYHTPEFSASKKTVPYDVIFPLKTVAFEGYELSCPNDADAYLKILYGDYMSYPHSGMLHHSGGENKMYLNCVKYGVDMDKLYTELKNIKVD